MGANLKVVPDLDRMVGSPTSMRNPFLKAVILPG
jgi:hypothetical protein